MIEQNALWAIIERHELPLMATININWFSNKVCFELFRCCVLCFSEKKELHYTILREYIHGADYSPQHRSAILAGLEQIHKAEYGLLDNYPQLLEEHYQEVKLSGLLKILNHPDNNASLKLQKIAETVRQINENSKIGEVKNYQDLINQYITKLLKGETDKYRERTINLQDALLGEMFGYKLYPEPVVIASRTGIGKTVFALNIVSHLWSLQKKGLYFAFEDSADTLKNKLFALRTNTAYSKVKSGDFTDAEKDKMRDFRKPDNYNRLWIYDKPLNILQFRSTVDRQFSIQDYDYIVIDFVQAFRAVKGQKKHEAIEQIMRDIIDITHEYYCPVIIVSQTNDRDEKKSGTVELDLGDLKESASLEENARMVFLIEGERGKPERKIKIAKNSAGPLFSMQVRFDFTTGRLS